jgi:hypothetical protein
LADPQQLNAYSYARNNPLIYVDPSGETPEEESKLLADIQNQNSFVIELVARGLNSDLL